MNWFRNASLRYKLLVVLMLISAISIISAAAGIIAYDSATLAQRRLEDLTTQAQILSAISSAAVSFADAKAATEYLSALRARPEIIAAAIYNESGHLLAFYRESSKGAVVPHVAEPPGHRVQDYNVILFYPILQNKEVIGTIYVHATIEPLYSRLARYAQIMAIIMVIALLVALLASTSLVSFIVGPILEIVRVARGVTERQDYSMRAIKHSSDEVGMLTHAFNQMLHRIQERETELQAANQALQREVGERRYAEREVRKLNDELERRVSQRTAQLEAANKELEAFSYSVSHDLRAPLRSIDGFSAALVEDYAHQLDQQALVYLQRVRAATHRMAELIDDMLTLARITRSEINLIKVDISGIANEVLNELRVRDPARNVEVHIESELNTVADPGLMRVALDNLIGNAWKFSGKQSTAKIEVGKMSIDGERVFFIKDNGAGFDMNYSNKLFGAFQRLHAVSEFEGTGVGLASVQRIVHRHGGRIWAVGEVNKGATFYFTIPEKSTHE